MITDTVLYSNLLQVLLFVPFLFWGGWRLFAMFPWVVLYCTFRPLMPTTVVYYLCGFKTLAILLYSSHNASAFLYCTTVTYTGTVEYRIVPYWVFSGPFPHKVRHFWLNFVSWWDVGSKIRTTFRSTSFCFVCCSSSMKWRVPTKALKIRAIIHFQSTRILYRNNESSEGESCNIGWSYVVILPILSATVSVVLFARIQQ